MKYFIELTSNYSNEEISLNPDYVVGIQQHKEYTSVYTGSKVWFEVKETKQQILEMIRSIECLKDSQKNS